MACKNPLGLDGQSIKSLLAFPKTTLIGRNFSEYKDLLTCESNNYNLDIYDLKCHPKISKIRSSQGATNQSCDTFTTHSHLATSPTQLLLYSFSHTQSFASSSSKSLKSLTGLAPLLTSNPAFQTCTSLIIVGVVPFPIFMLPSPIISAGATSSLSVSPTGVDLGEDWASM